MLRCEKQKVYQERPEWSGEEMPVLDLVSETEIENLKYTSQMSALLTVMLRALLTRSVILAVLLLFNSAHGLPVVGIYSERVPVANESDAERSQAFKNALKVVLVRATGEQRHLSHPAVLEALENAQSYVEAIRYFSETVIPTSSSGEIGPQQTLPEAAVQPSVDESSDELMPDPDKQRQVAPTTTEQRFIEVEFLRVD